jgi:hypothetical protein
MVITTKPALAKAGTKSMKTTIPEGIVEFLELTPSDELEWRMDVESNQRAAILTKRISSVDLAREAMRLKKVRRKGEL